MGDGDKPVHQQACELADEHLRLLQRWQQLRGVIDAQGAPYDKNEFGRVTQRLRESQAALQEFVWRHAAAGDSR